MSETLPPPDIQYLLPDAKGKVSETFGRLKVTTSTNFPDPDFHTKVINGEAVIDFHSFGSYRGSDGSGTRDELFERLHEQFDDPTVLRKSCRGAVAMIDGDAIRRGGFLVGIDNTIDVKSAENYPAMEQLSIGLDESVAELGCAVTSGEVAELGYRAGGYGKFHFNWNMSGTVLDVPEKRLEAKNLKPGQLLVAFREESLRSNGFTAAREAMEEFCLNFGWGKEAIAALHLTEFVKLRDQYGLRYAEPGSREVRMIRDWALERVAPLYNERRNELPWHVIYPDITQELTMPPKFYSPIMYEAQGGVYGERKVDMIAAAHITGGGIPLKGVRMVHSQGLGLAVDHVFPDPKALQSMMELAEKNGGHSSFADRAACDTWNRGIGFLVVVPDKEEAKKLIDVAGNHDCEAAIAGEVTDTPAVQFRNHVWPYYPNMKCP